MSGKSKTKMKKVWRGILKGLLTKKAYCIYVEKKHNLEYRSTVQNNFDIFGPRQVHINSCSNCGFVKIVDC